MFVPHEFKNENLDEVKDFIRQNSFGILINAVDGKFWGSHIPLELETEMGGEEEVLYGHIAKANIQLSEVVDQAPVLAIFNGPHSYVSSSWYNHENVPTWNYIAVHIHGQIELVSGDELYYSLKKLVDKYEQNSEHPVAMETMSANTLKQMRGIIGFKIRIESIKAAYKLSQNRNKEDYHNVVEKLENMDGLSKDIGKEMKKRDGYLS